MAVVLDNFFWQITHQRFDLQLISHLEMHHLSCCFNMSRIWCEFLFHGIYSCWISSLDKKEDALDSFKFWLFILKSLLHFFVHLHLPQPFLQNYFKGSCMIFHVFSSYTEEINFLLFIFAKMISFSMFRSSEHISLSDEFSSGICKVSHFRQILDANIQVRVSYIVDSFFTLTWKRGFLGWDDGMTISSSESWLSCIS